ncbi:hypothetical protein JHK86_010271 [Glycine max]|nr:hypothetical protein JHK86_010271 [Glycine max]
MLRQPRRFDNTNVVEDMIHEFKDGFIHHRLCRFFSAFHDTFPLFLAIDYQWRSLHPWVRLDEKKPCPLDRLWEPYDLYKQVNDSILPIIWNASWSDENGREKAVEEALEALKILQEVLKDKKSLEDRA